MLNRTLHTHAVQNLNAVHRNVGYTMTWLFLVIFGCAVHAEQPVAVGSAAVAEDMNYRDNSDAELTHMVKNWASLSPTERRLLLSEIRSRMKLAKTPESSGAAAKNGDARSKNNLDLNEVMARQSYGRTVRRPDGSLVTETETIKITPRGRQVTRQTTITAANSARGPLNQTSKQEAGAADVVGPSNVVPPQRVMRTKIRFGTGFEQRRSTAADPAAVAIQPDTDKSVPIAEPPKR